MNLEKNPQNIILRSTKLVKWSLKHFYKNIELLGNI